MTRICYEHPRNRIADDDEYKKVNMNSDTCIDDLDIQVKFDGDQIVDVRYDGEACAICNIFNIYYESSSERKKQS